jgi:hypothetical protein
VHWRRPRVSSGTTDVPCLRNLDRTRASSALPRSLVLLVLLYIVVDFSNPLIPGAFVFETEESIECTGGAPPGGRGAPHARQHVSTPVIPFSEVIPPARLPRSLGRPGATLPSCRRDAAMYRCRDQTASPSASSAAATEDD